MIPISIHALLAESDASNRRERQEQHDFYPRSPCGERHSNFTQKRTSSQFLSTLSLRRATMSARREASESIDFYPRSPCGERLHYDNYNLHCVEISIHALLAESDNFSVSVIELIEYFYPRSPCGERLLDTVQIVIVKIFLSTLSLRRATPPAGRNN